MDSDNIYFLGVTGWKDPFLYVAIALSVVLYLLSIFFSNNSSTGVLETTKGGRIIAAILSWSFLAFFIHSETSLFAKVHSMIFRVFILLFLIAITLIVILPAWGGTYFDSEKMYSFTRLFPCQLSHRNFEKDVTFYSNIESISTEASSDGSGSLILHLKDGSRKYISPNVSYENLNGFIITLYDECEWLRENIVTIFGSIEKRREQLFLQKSIGTLMSESIFNIIGILIVILLLFGMIKKTLHLS